MALMNDNKKTHFGYKSVDPEDKTDLVGEVFTSVAHKYDLMNDLMSLGMHRLWKKFAIDILNLKKGQKVLDLATGSADLARLMAKKVGAQGSVVATDINPSMLQQGIDKSLNQGMAENLQFQLANAEALDFEDNSFDAVTIGFGLRNVTHKEKALQEIHRVLKITGKLLVLEFSEVKAPLAKKLYDAYSFQVIPKIGKWVANDEASYQYLAESIRVHPNQDLLKQMLEDAGFSNCYFHNMSLGVVAIHVGYKL